MYYNATRWFAFLCLFVFSFTALTLPQAAMAGGNKVEVCHIPPDDPENFHSILIGSKALNAHLNHLDLEGACNEVCAEICDDGDACTIDDDGDCEVAGCPAEPELVDCDDGNLCTINSCDPDDGCLTVPVDCGEGFSCNPVDGSCVADCPGDFEEMLALDFADSGGVLIACGEGFIAEGAINYFGAPNSSYYCSGTDGCLVDGVGNPIRGWGYLREFNGSSWDDSDVYPGLDDPAMTPEEDAACRAILMANCATDESTAAESLADQPILPAPIVVQ